MRRLVAAVLLLALLFDFAQAEQQRLSPDHVQRPSSGASFLQRKMVVANKLKAQKARIAQLQQRALARQQQQQRDDPSGHTPTVSTAAPSGFVPAVAADPSSHPPASSVDSNGDARTEQPSSRVDQWFDDKSGVKATLARMLISRQALTLGSGEYAPPALSADSQFIHWVNSVTHACYYNSDNADRVFLDLELASGRVFGMCSRTGLRTCSFDHDANSFNREHTCEPVHLQVQQTADGSLAVGCGDYDETMPPSDSNGRQSLCTCANAWIDACHCVYELSATQRDAFCVASRAPVAW